MGKTLSDQILQVMFDVTRKWTVNCETRHEAIAEGCKIGRMIIKNASAKKLELEHVKCLLCAISHPKGESKNLSANEEDCYDILVEEKCCMIGDLIEELGLMEKEKQLSWHEQFRLILVRNARRTVRKSISSRT